MRNEKGQFIKGNKPERGFSKNHKPWNTGLTKNDNPKVGGGRKFGSKDSKPRNKENYKFLKPWFIGRKLTEEHKEKIKLSNTGKTMSTDWVNRMKVERKGSGNPMFNKKWKDRQRDIFHKKTSGENHYRYIKDRTKLKGYGSIDSIDRRSGIYKDWRIRVYKRDNFKCRIEDENCKGKIEAHHILRFENYPELRYNINNGITLCHFHHPRKRLEEIKMVETFKEIINNKS